jgi:hypothetical protein
MNKLGARPWLLAVAFALGLTLTSGCQTYFIETGQTLPSPEYLRHPPTFIPPTPAFPLAKEQSSLEQAAAQPTAMPRVLLPQGGVPIAP